MAASGYGAPNGAGVSAASLTQGDGGVRGPSAPTLSLPQGGGSVRGLGEKFAANPVTGTASWTVPIPVSPGRSGFGPDLVLSYDSGGGNGPFGHGWHLGVPAVTRKTSKGLPQYLDATESDVFLMSDTEDLVPELDAAGHASEWVREVAGASYRIRRYRPRIEGAFARIERWTRQGDGDVHWRTYSPDNVLSLYGTDLSSRVCDPADPWRTFSWLLAEVRDDKGNAVVYEYKAEDGAGVDLRQVHERHRGERDDPSRSASRYLKRIRYGNRLPLLDAGGHRPPFSNLDDAGDWFFEVVLDYGEHDVDIPLPTEQAEWTCRRDPFSSHRAGFEVRHYRLCRRILMFHHFPAEPDVGANCLVAATSLTYRGDAQRGEPGLSLLTRVTHTGYQRARGGGYLGQDLPPLDFTYSEATFSETVRDVDPESLANLPQGVSQNRYWWVDLDGEGLPGILTEQAGAWFYKPNWGGGRLGPQEIVAAQPSPVAGGALGRRAGEGGALRGQAGASGARKGRGQAGMRFELLDVSGSGRVDLTSFGPPLAGTFRRTSKRDWEAFRAFAQLPNLDWGRPDLRFVDLTGDGKADLLLTEDEAFTWYPSLAEAGFGTARRVAPAWDDVSGPMPLFTQDTESAFLADVSGDGLADVVRIRNGEVCYWPNLGYGRFGARVQMDGAPILDAPDQFDPRRIRMVDVDGSGHADLIYLGRDGVQIYPNHSGNGWGAPRLLAQGFMTDDLTAVDAVDLLGSGTACLVWSSPLPANAQRPMRYIDLTGGVKPHLLVGMRNNRGAETRVRYASSTHFYHADRVAGRRWHTQLPFPVHVVERVEMYDHIARNRYVTRYAYHHGDFDGEEREFRGFGMVEQWDTEHIEVPTRPSAAGDSDSLPLAATQDASRSGLVISPAANLDAASHVPPVCTCTWFHTGRWVPHADLSELYESEYYAVPREWPQRPAVEIPADLDAEATRQAHRALKGAVLRQEVYAADGSVKAQHPYTVAVWRYAVRQLQRPRHGQDGVYLTLPQEEEISHYERNPADPRVVHELVLETDSFGRVVKAASVAYGRRTSDPRLSATDRAEQARTWVAYSEQVYTHAIDTDDAYRPPVPCEARTYELTGYAPVGERFVATDFALPDPTDPAGLGRVALFDTEIPFEAQAPAGRVRRLLSQSRTYYRPNDCGTAAGDPLALLPLGTWESLALPGESYQLALTDGLLARTLCRGTGDPTTQPPQAGDPATPTALLSDPAAVLTTGGSAADRGGYVDLDGDGRYWAPSGRTFLSPFPGDAPAAERTYAQRHFFLSCRMRDPFHTASVPTEALVTYDVYDLLPIEVKDALGNRVTAGERDARGHVTKSCLDYRVLQPHQTMDANRNRTAVAFDALGNVVGSAVMGKPESFEGDRLDGFEANLAQEVVQAHLADPQAGPQALLAEATSRIVYDLFAYMRTADTASPQPVVVHTLTRETHAADLEAGERSPIQQTFAYFDGMGRTVQTKQQAAPIGDASATTGARWTVSGWTVQNNKGLPVRVYEPFFSKVHQFEFAHAEGVAATRLYDPLGRLVAVLHPDHTVEKVVFDAWSQTAFDVNDMVLQADLQSDPDVGPLFQRLPAADYLPTWYAARSGGQLGPAAEDAAKKAAEHADTPTVSHFDSLGRAFATVTHNRGAGDPNLAPADPPRAVDVWSTTRVVRDILGLTLRVLDAQGRVAARYAYDMLGNNLHRQSMEAGEQWGLYDVGGNPVRAWDARGHAFRFAYDALRRPTAQWVRGTDVAQSDPRTLNQEVLYQRIVYGEAEPEAEVRNLRTRAVRQYDDAGIVTMGAYDFKGNVLESTRHFAADYKGILDWSGAPELEPDLVFTASTRYDALGRATWVAEPDGSNLRPSYDLAGHLVRVEVKLHDERQDGVPGWRDFITHIEYDAHGRALQITYGNDVATHYDYDALTFRLARLLTVRRKGRSPSDGPDRSGDFALQNLHYTYDAAGNMTRIEDRARQDHFFRNRRVEAACEYTYDALYRLVEATGREHVGQAGTPAAYSAWDRERTALLHPHDGLAMATYTERYRYDATGNLLAMHHQSHAPAGASWTRTFSHTEPSRIDTGATTNRLSRTRVDGAEEAFAYDVHGNTIRMPHLQRLVWDCRDQLRATSTQAAAAGTPETTYYVYDATGRRVRKVTERAAAPGATPVRKAECIDVGHVSIAREYGAAGKLKEAVVTLEVTAAGRRVALVETRTHRDGRRVATPEPRTRYQLTTHAGAVAIELSDVGDVISYEEFSPYGSTAYQAVQSDLDASPKRYRYAGHERDEESGLYYHGARYYAPWLGRWISPDPAGLVDGLNLYRYCRNNPVTFQDPSGTESISVTGGSDQRHLLDPAKEDDARAYFEAQLTERYGDEHYEARVHSMRWSKEDNLWYFAVDWVPREGGPGAEAGGADADGPPTDEPSPGQALDTSADGKDAAAADTGEVPISDPPPAADSGSGAGEEDRRPRSALSSAMVTFDGFNRGAYMREIREQADKALSEIAAAGKQTPPDLDAAEASARKAHGERNKARSQAQRRQLRVNPGGYLMSRVLDQDRSWSYVTRKYGGERSIQMYEDIADASGRSRGGLKFLSKLGRVTGPVGIVYGAAVSIDAVADAEPGMRGQVAAAEASSHLAGAAGYSAGMAVGALAGKGLIALGVAAGPAGWVALGVGLAAGAAFSYLASEWARRRVMAR